MENLSGTKTITFNNVDDTIINENVNINKLEKDSELYIDLLLSELHSNIINVNDINESNKYEELFLYLIRVNNVKDCIRLLNLRKISNINYQNKDGNTALHYSLANNLKEATYFLLFTLKVNYNVLNTSNNSPLYWGVLNKSIESIKILLLYDYNVNINSNKDYREYNINNLLSNLENINRNELKLDNEVANYYNLNNLDNKSFLNEYIKENRIDILKKNQFNVSILSELYNINNLDLLQLILEHPISNVLDVNQTNGDNSTDSTSGSTANNNLNNNVEIKDNNGNVSNFGSNSYNSNTTTRNNESNESYIIHEFQFIDSSLNNNGLQKPNDYRILIKEIGIDNSSKILDSKDSELDSSGLIIWESSIISSFWIFNLLKKYSLNGYNDLYNNGIGNMSSKTSGSISYNTNNNNNHNNVVNTNNNYIDLKLKNVFNNNNSLKILELGSGCGLLGISVFKTLKYFNKNIEKLVLSDYSENTLKNLKYNLELNNLLNEENGVEMMQINWKCFTVKEEYDVIIGCDLIYDVELVRPLIYVIGKLLSKDGVFLYTYKLIRNGIDQFINELNDKGFILSIENVPKEYQQNPFVDKPKEYCLSFFPDLGSDDYMLLKAVKSPDV